jgi:polysaccharide export outer membrane protein
VKLKCGIIVFIFVIFLSSCVNLKNTRKDIEVVDEDVVSTDIDNVVSKALDSIRNKNNYVLQYGDLIEIKVFRESSMDRVLRLPSDGFITFPLIGKVKISGQSISAAEDKISRALKKYIQNPFVNVDVKEYGNNSIFVLGQVNNPSAISMPPERTLTLLEAISSAGGFTDVAVTSKIRILRTKTGKSQTIIINTKKITKQGAKSFDIPLMPGDVIFVPQSLF